MTLPRFVHHRRGRVSRPATFRFLKRYSPIAHIPTPMSFRGAKRRGNLLVQGHNTKEPKNQRARYSPIPFIPPHGKSNLPPGDSHVASLLGMTYFLRLQYFVTAQKPQRGRRGHAPALRSVLLRCTGGTGDPSPTNLGFHIMTEGRVKTLPYGFCCFTWYVHPRDCTTGIPYGHRTT